MSFQYNFKLSRQIWECLGSLIFVNSCMCLNIYATSIAHKAVLLVRPNYIICSPRVSANLDVVQYYTHIWPAETAANTVIWDPSYLWHEAISQWRSKTDRNKESNRLPIYITVYLWKLLLTHWGRLTHICVSKLTSIASDNGLSPGRRQAIIWTNAGILIIGPLWTNFSEILI